MLIALKWLADKKFDLGGKEMTLDGDLDPELELSASTLNALKEFLQEQKSLDNSTELDPVGKVQEDWQLSQFWYTKETCQDLSREILENTKNGDKIACISSPSVYKELVLREDLLERTVYLLEFDSRFGIYENFIYYDYNDPLSLPMELMGEIDYIIVDPPFLSVECWGNVAKSVKALLKKNGKVCACTGVVMKRFLSEELNVTETDYSPQHANGLQNEFKAFVNYSSGLRSEEWK